MSRFSEDTFYSQHGDRECDDVHGEVPHAWWVAFRERKSLGFLDPPNAPRWGLETLPGAAILALPVWITVGVIVGGVGGWIYGWISDGTDLVRFGVSIGATFGVLYAVLDLREHWREFLKHNRE